MSRTNLKIGYTSTNCHARESGHPERPEKSWIPVYTGMTLRDPMRQEGDFEIGSKSLRIIIAAPSVPYETCPSSVGDKREGPMVNYSTIKILKYKAESLRTSPEYASYVETVLKDLDIKDAKEAFVLGAVDAMINGAASSMDGAGILKKSLLKAIAKKGFRIH